MKIYYKDFKLYALNLSSVPVGIFIGHLVETGKITKHNDGKSDYVEFLDLIPFKNAVFPSTMKAYSSAYKGFVDKFTLETVLGVAQPCILEDYSQFIYHEAAIPKEEIYPWRNEEYVNDIEEINQWIEAPASTLSFNAIGSVELQAFYVVHEGAFLYIDGDGDVTGYYGGFNEDKWGLMHSLFKELGIRQMYFTASEAYQADMLPNTQRARAVADGCHWSSRTKDADADTALYIYTGSGKHVVHFDIIKCRECGEYHVLSYTEINWLRENGYQNPARCRKCREARKSRT